METLEQCGKSKLTKTEEPLSGHKDINLELPWKVFVLYCLEKYGNHYADGEKIYNRLVES